MSAISLKSITGITSITTPAGVDDQLTLHNNNTTERVKIDVAGNVHINNQLAVAGVTTMSGNLTISNTDPRIIFVDTNNNPDFTLHANGGDMQVENSGSGTQVKLESSGSTRLFGNVIANKDLDVDGHTNLDNVSISGVTTITGALHADGFSTVGGEIAINGTVPRIGFTDSNANSDFRIKVDGGSFQIEDITNSSADRFTINSSGNVSIAKDLDVDGHTNLDNVSVAGVSTFSGLLTANGEILMTGAGTILELQAHGGPSIGFKDTNGNSFAFVSQTGGTFRVATSGNSYTPKLVINPAGLVGINTTVPSALLNVNTPSSGVTDAIVISRDLYGMVGKLTNSTGALTVTSNKQLILQSDPSSQFTAAGSFIAFETDGTEKVRIRNDGHVGIGTDIPTYKLHVDSGDAAIGLWKSRRSSGSYIEYAVGVNGAALGYIGAGGQICTGGPDSGDFAIRSQGDLCFSAGGSDERVRIDETGHLHIKGTDHATRYYRDAGDRYGSIFYNGSHFVIRQPNGDNLQIEKFDGTILHRFNTAGDLSVGHDSPQRKLHVKSGANNNNGAFRIESAPGNIMDMGTDSSMHFLNCVSNDPFRIKFAGNEAIRVTQETSGNWTTSLQFYMETNNGQGASPYIKGVAGTESGGLDAHNAGGFEFHTRTGGAGTDVNAMKIDHNGRVSIGAHNIQNPTAALHIIADTQGTNTALQVGQDSGGRYFRVNEINGQANFLECLLSYYDNTLANVLKLQNTFAGAANYGTAIQFIGHGGSQTGRIAVKNRDVNSASNSIMEMEASYVLKPSVPSFHAYNVSGTQATVLTFANTWHNIGNHFNASTGTFTCPVSGRYLFTFAFLHNNGPTSYARVMFRINGSSSTRYGDTLCDDTGLYINTSMSMVFNLSINDTVQLYNDGNNIYGSQYGAFSGYLLG